MYAKVRESKKSILNIIIRDRSKTPSRENGFTYIYSYLFVLLWRLSSGTVKYRDNLTRTWKSDGRSSSVTGQIKEGQIPDWFLKWFFSFDKEVTRRILFSATAADLFMADLCQASYWRPPSTSEGLFLPVDLLTLGSN